MIIVDTTALLTREVSIDHGASEIRFFTTVVSPYGQD